MRIAVLLSGTGSNLQAILDAQRNGALGGAEVALALSNLATARGLERAAAAGVEALHIDHRGFPDRAAFEVRIVEELRSRGIEYVALAGFMRLLGPTLLDAFPDRVVNIHPSLLPAFPGLHAQRQALLYGVKIAGCTVHFVDSGTDSGPIIAQAAVRVLDDDDETSLSARNLVEEHRLYPRVLRAIAEQRVRRSGRLVSLREP